MQNKKPNDSFGFYVIFLSLKLIKYELCQLVNIYFPHIALVDLENIIAVQVFNIKLENKRESKRAK